MSIVKELVSLVDSAAVAAAAAQAVAAVAAACQSVFYLNFIGVNLDLSEKL